MASKRKVVSHKGTKGKHEDTKLKPDFLVPLCLSFVPLCEIFSPLSANPKEDIYSKLIEALVRQRLARQLNAIQLHVLHSLGVVLTVTSERLDWSTIPYLREQRLHILILIKLPRLLFQYQIVPHAPRRERPHAILVFTAIRMRIEVSWSIVSTLQQPHEEEQVLDRLRPKPQILIETR